MDLNIDQLDGEERKKINALLRERNDTDKNKGVDYIFKQSDEREEYLMGKKIDLNKMVKDDKAMMGESEIEFKERMERRKINQKLREDPMAIIQLNEQQARKVAIEKARAHQKLSKMQHSKFQRNQSVSSDSSEDCEDQLRKLLKNMENDDDNHIGDILNISNNNNSQKHHVSKSPKRNKNNEDQSRGRSRSKNRKHRQRSRSRSKDKKRYKNSESRDNLKYGINNDKRHKRSDSRQDQYVTRHTKNRKSKRSRSISSSPERTKRNYDSSRRKTDKIYQRKPECKSKLSKEEKERRLQEMRDNANELDSTINNLDKKYKSQEKIEAEQVEKNLHHNDEYMFKEMVRMNNQQFSLQRNIQERTRQSQLNKIFKS